MYFTKKITRTRPSIPGLTQTAFDLYPISSMSSLMLQSIQYTHNNLCSLFLHLINCVVTIDGKQF